MWLSTPSFSPSRIAQYFFALFYVRCWHTADVRMLYACIYYYLNKIATSLTLA